MKLARPKSSITQSTNSTSASPIPSVVSLKTESEEQSGRAKPHFLVKQVDREEVLEESFRQRNYAGLTQINEENTGDLDEIMLLHPKLVKPEPTAPIKTTGNMFKMEMINQSKYKELAKGPLFEDNKVVKHSIVGSVDTFERWDRHLKRNDGKDSRGVYIDKGSTSDVSLLKHIRPTSPSLYDEPSSVSSRLGSQGSLFARKLNVISEKKKNQNADLRMSKDDLLNEIEKIQERQTAVSRAESKRPKTGNLGERLYLSKEERILSKCEKVDNQWQKIIEKLTHRVHRDGGASVMVTLENFREKKELANMLDLVKTDEEKYGSKIWYRTLRKPSGRNSAVGKATKGQKEEEESVQERLVALHNEFSGSAMEVIRKPYSIKTIPEINKICDVNQSRSEKEYLNLKFLSRKQGLHGVIPPKSEDVGDLIITGKNKFELEARAILKKAESQGLVKVPRGMYEKKGVEEFDKTIERNKSKTQILRNGLGSFII